MLAIANFTNLYAAQNIAKYSTYGDKHGAWLDTGTDEMYYFLAVIIYMGLVRAPSYDRYWSRAPLYSGLWARRFLPSRDRFLSLLAFLHVVDPANENPQDKLKKVRFLYDHVRGMCRNLYQPRRELSIDERMVKSKGRFGFKQYIKNKPVRWGFKLFALCCSVTGYLYDFIVYTGRQNDSVSEHGPLHDVVVQLCEPFCNQGYKAYFDRFYTSPQLVTTLLNNGIRSLGTCQTNRRGYPQQLKNLKAWDKTSKRGDIRWVRDGALLFIQWKDKRTVSLLSSLHDANDSVVVQRHTKQNGQHVMLNVQQPIAVCEYNEFMGGVDVFDQMIAAYRILRKTKKWWKTLFFDLLDVAVVNAYLLYREHALAAGTARKDLLTQLEFRETLVRDLAGIGDNEEIPQPPKGRRKRSASDIEDQHPPKVAPSNQRRNCVVCYRRDHVQRRTRFYCDRCVISNDGRKAYLCLSEDRDCWPVYHSREFDALR